MVQPLPQQFYRCDSIAIILVSSYTFLSSFNFTLITEFKNA
jgi:hypothetical protein